MLVVTQVALTRTVNGFIIRQAEPQDFDGADRVIRGVLERDLGGYKPDLHYDVGRLAEVYSQPRFCLLVAVDEQTGEVAGTAAVRPGGPKSPPHPQWLCDKYDPDKTAQLFRFYIDPAYRRRGLARELLDAARYWITSEGGYEVIYLHTDPRSPGAEAYWRSMPTIEVYDGRTEGGSYQTLHFEMPFPDHHTTTHTPDR
jgi:ribosomal protein S18 acetylase RimI-like enzyme